MIGAAREASAVPIDLARELVGWRPALGVVSLYVNADPADRGGGWRIEARNGLARVLEDADNLGHDASAALKATVKRIQGELESNSEPPPRGLVSFFEVSSEPGETRGFTTQLPPPRTAAFHSERPWLGPLITLVDEGAPLGIAAISAERVRLLHWTLGRVEEIENWELELYMLDWRERKAQRPTDPATGQAVSSSGRDQFDQRVGANRERFAHETGELARPIAGERGWQRLLVFGDRRYADRFAAGFSDDCELHFVDSSDLVTQPTAQIAERVAALLPKLRQVREQTLLERLNDAAYAEGRAAFGRQETMQALEQGKVERLVYDSRRDGIEVEQMIELALPTGAAISPLMAEVADRLEDKEGVAAILRY